MPVCSTRPKTINRKTEQQQAAYACAPPLAGPWDAMEPIRRMCRWIAALSARVGSIGDNRTGGWHGYRALKAALNMIIRNLAIETARRTPETLCVGLTSRPRYLARKASLPNLRLSFCNAKQKLTSFR